MVSVLYVLVCSPLAVLQYSDQKQFERERVYLAYRLFPISHRWGKRETMKNSACCLASLACSGAFLKKLAPSTEGLAL